MTFTQIPIIDFAPFTEGNATEKQAVVEQIYAACHQVGFMYLRNIGISRSLLLQDRIGGLEVKTRQGDWIAAPPIENTIVVNVGDAMQRGTNDRLSSTPHRVAVPLLDRALLRPKSRGLDCLFRATRRSICSISAHLGRRLSRESISRHLLNQRKFDDFVTSPSRPLNSPKLGDFKSKFPIQSPSEWGI